MDFSIKACDWSKGAQDALAAVLAASATGKSLAGHCIVAGVFDASSAQPLPDAARALDAAAGGLFARIVEAGDIDGKAGATLLVPEVAGLNGARVLLVSLGPRDAFGQKAYHDAVKAAWRALTGTKIAQVTFTLAQSASAQAGAQTGAPATACAKNPAPGAAQAVRQAILALRGETYRFTQMKSKPERAQHALRRVTFSVHADDLKAAKRAAKEGVALANGMDLARDLGNLPGNVCTPGYLADAAKKFAHDWKLQVEVLGRKQIEALKMGAFLAVAKGSAEPPQFIVLRYDGHPGAGAQAVPIVLVGKGITFDSGGISLKPGEGMDEMKYDMCGAGSVLGTLRAIAELGLKLNVIGLVPTCENLPSGVATKPGDVVTSLAGLTIEVLNTDAEGRLILCDALTYAARFKPAAVIDVATLTGACVIALGHYRSGLFSPDDALANELLRAARAADDPAWRLPLDDVYQEQLKSNFADLANIGGRPAGSVTAACFLARFAQDYPWAHLDIAGTAWKSGTAKGATGRPVPLLAQFLIDRAS